MAWFRRRIRTRSVGGGGVDGGQGLSLATGTQTETMRFTATTTQSTGSQSHASFGGGDITTTPDISGNARHFTVDDGVSVITSPFAGGASDALLFSGNDNGANSSGLSNPESYGIVSNAQWCIEGEVRRDRLAGHEAIVGRWPLGRPGNEFLIYFDPGDSGVANSMTSIVKTSDGSNVILNTPSAASIGNHTYKLDFDGTTLRFIVDGSIVESYVPTMPFSAPSPNVPTAVGKCVTVVTTSTLPLLGAHGRLRISNTSRGTGANAYTVDANTLGLWPMDELNTVSTSPSNLQAASTIRTGTETETMAASATGSATRPQGTQTETMGFSATQTRSQGTETATFVASAIADLSQYTTTAADQGGAAPVWANPTQAQGAFNSDDAATPSNTASHPGLSGLQTSVDATLRCSGLVVTATPSGFTRTGAKIRIRHKYELATTSPIAGVKDMTYDLDLRTSADVLIANIKRVQSSGGSNTVNPLLIEDIDITGLVSDAQLAAGVKVDAHIFSTGAQVAALDGTTIFIDGVHLVAQYSRTGIS